MFERLDLIRSRDASPASGSVVDTLQAALLLIRTAPATITAPLVRAIDSQSALHSLRVLSRPTVTDLMIGYLAAQAQTIRLWCGDLPDEGWIEIKVQGAALVEIEQSVIAEDQEGSSVGHDQRPLLFLDVWGDIAISSYRGKPRQGKEKPGEFSRNSRRTESRALGNAAQA